MDAEKQNWLDEVVNGMVAVYETMRSSSATLLDLENNIDKYIKDVTFIHGRAWGEIATSTLRELLRNEKRGLPLPQCT